MTTTDASSGSVSTGSPTMTSFNGPGRRCLYRAEVVEHLQRTLARVDATDVEKVGIVAEAMLGSETFAVSLGDEIDTHADDVAHLVDAEATTNEFAFFGREERIGIGHPKNVVEQRDPKHADVGRGVDRPAPGPASRDLWPSGSTSR